MQDFSHQQYHIYTWNPNGAPCFDWSLGLVLGGWTFKNRGHWGSRYIYIYIDIIYYIYINGLVGPGRQLPIYFQPFKGVITPFIVGAHLLGDLLGFVGQKKTEFGDIRICARPINSVHWGMII